jgi:hypothetical protein
MKVQTDTRIDVVNPTHQAYTTLLENIYKEFLALKAQSTSEDAGEEAPPEPREAKAAAS